MNAATLLTKSPLAGGGPTRENKTSLARGAGVGLFVLPAAAWWFTRKAPPWCAMWAVASAEFFALKLLTVSGFWRVAPVRRLVGYLLLWPGMDAAAFLGVCVRKKPPAPTSREWALAGAKFTAGLVCIGWALAQAQVVSAMLLGWVGMIGIIFLFHFGLFHLASLAWRSAGINAAPLMRAPIAAQSLAEFWSERWNAAFADAARRFLVRPFARRWGAARMGMLVFLVSGLVHESVISLPARGGWGGPTLYFVLQAAGVSVEKSIWGRRFGLGRGVLGWTWTLVVTVAPVSLLFHPAFVTRVMAPFFQTLAELKP